jgi:hypothetical protein
MDTKSYEGQLVTLPYSGFGPDLVARAINQEEDAAAFIIALKVGTELEIFDRENEYVIWMGEPIPHEGDSLTVAAPPVGIASLTWADMVVENRRAILKIPKIMLAAYGLA